MDRTAAPGHRDRRYVDEDRNAGVQGTAIIAADRNAVQEELIHLIEAGGLAPSAGDDTQLRRAVEAIAVREALAMPPIGTIWMYDGAGWVDNVTLPGWYACIPENEDGGASGLSFGIVSMVDRFVMGRGNAAVGAVGGTNSYQLTAGQLPSHTHTINHDHTAFTSGGESRDHSHSVSGSVNGSGSHNHWDGFRHSYGNSGAYVYAMSGNQGSIGVTYSNTSSVSYMARTSSTSHSHTWSGSSGGRSAGHTHAINVPNYAGNSGGTGGGQTIDNRPAFYSMVFIRKCV